MMLQMYDDWFERGMYRRQCEKQGKPVVEQEYIDMMEFMSGQPDRVWRVLRLFTTGNGESNNGNR